MNRSLVLAGLAVVLVVCATAASSPAGISYRTVALSGMQAPGCPAGTFWIGFGGINIDGAGNVAFNGVLEDTAGNVDGTNHRGLWLQHGASIDLLARMSDPAVGLPAGLFFDDPTYHSYFALGRGGDFIFHARLQDESGSIQTILGDAIWHAPNGTMSVLIRGYEPAAGAPAGMVYQALSDVAISRNGAVLFEGHFGTPPASVDEWIAALWSTRSGSLQIVTKAGDPAPGLPPGSTFRHAFGSSNINDDGHISFSAFYDSPAGRGVGVWSDSGGPLSLVAHEGQPAPGTPDNAVFNSFVWGIGYVTMNSLGRVVFTCELYSPTASYSDSVWVHDTSGAVLVARTYEPAPGAPAGVMLGGFSDDPVIDDTGAVAFNSRFITGQGGVDDSNNSGLWYGQPGAIGLIAREGDQAPGCEEGVLFGTFDVRYGAACLNGIGQLAFAAGLKGEGVDPSNDHAIWATDQNGQLILVARDGDLFEVGPGDWRTIDWWSEPLSASGGLDGNGTPFNSNGELVITLRFTDGSNGVFVATVPPPPLSGDADLDGDVDMDDFVILKQNFSATDVTTSEGDFDGDGDVDMDDFVILKQNFGTIR